MQKNDRLLRALKRQEVDVTPVWMMRQAGRYLPEYRATRQEAGSFIQLCKTPKLACEVTLQPLQRFTQLDAVILFSDILTIPDALGLGLYFIEGEGPKFQKVIHNADDINSLPKINAQKDLSYVMQTIELVKNELNGVVPLIGFAGSPWTIATYMCEGGASRDFPTIKTMLYEQPKTLHALLEHLTICVTDYLAAQINSGVNVIQIFDSWGGSLSYAAYQEFSLAYMQRIIRQLDPKVPIILFSKGAVANVTNMAKSGAAALGLDWTCSLKEVRDLVGDKVALQGNMDPAVLRAHPEAIKQEVARILQDFGNVSDGFGHIFNLGHGITPDINPANVDAFFNAVHSLSAQYH